jgi:hypothetical protein
MKIIHWNCQGAFRKKSEQILKYNPDILIISECEEPSKLRLDEMINRPIDYFWYGDNPNKGIGFFSIIQFHIKSRKHLTPILDTLYP